MTVTFARLIQVSFQLKLSSSRGFSIDADASEEY